MDKMVKAAAAYITKYAIYSLDAPGPRLKPDEVLIDQSNRDNVFVHPVGAMEGAERVHAAGWVLKKARCVCVQFPLDKQKVDEIIRYNQEEGEKEKALPAVKIDLAGYTALGGNHTNTWLRMVSQGREVDRETFCSLNVNGKWVLSLSTLREKDPAHAEAVENGCHWIVLSRAMLYEEPRAREVIQAAENMESSCRHVTTPPHWRPLSNHRAN